MTTGTIQSGADNSPFLRYRSWTGANGKSVYTHTVPPRYFRWRSISGWRLAEFRETKLVSRGRNPRWTNHPPKGILQNQVVSVAPVGKTRLVYKRVTTYLEPLYDVHTVMRYGRPRVNTSWNAYTVTGRRQTMVKGTHPLYGNWLGKPPGAWDTALLWTANDDQKLYAKLASSVRGHSFNMGIAVAEGRKTVAMVAMTLTRFTGAIKSLKRGRIDLALRHLGVTPEPRHLHRTTRRGQVTVWDDKRKVHVTRPGPLTFDDVSKMWLEIQYGWRPLLQDVYEATNAYAAITAKARVKRYIVSHTIRNEFSAANWNSTTNYYGVVYSRKRIVYEATEILSLPRTLGLADPRPILWEVVPFSFVVDWFIPIGTYLDNLATIPKLTGRFLIQQKRTNQYQWKCSTPSPYNIAFVGASGACFTTYYGRSVSTSLSVPYPEFNDLSKALSLGHLKNALALLHVAVMK